MRFWLGSAWKAGEAKAGNLGELLRKQEEDRPSSEVKSDGENLPFFFV